MGLLAPVPRGPHNWYRPHRNDGPTQISRTNLDGNRAMLYILVQMYVIDTDCIRRTETICDRLRLSLTDTESLGQCFCLRFRRKTFIS